MRRRILATFALLLAAWGGSPAASQVPEKERALLDQVGITQRVGDTLPMDARFTDQDGRDVALEDVFGERPVILALVYYECPMLCTLVLSGLVSSLKAVGLQPAEDYDVVAISIDPGELPGLARRKRDAYAKELGKDGSAAAMQFLTGDEPEIERVADAVGFRYAYDAENDEYSHAAAIMVATPEGELARYFYGVEYSPRDLRFALVEASEGRVGSVVDQVLLLCFHYDPTKGKYGLVILNVIRLGGGITLALLVGFIGWSLFVERRKRRMQPARQGGGL